MGTNFTLHVRLTKRCNADCSYCSSYGESRAMTPSEYRWSLEYIAELLPSIRGKTNGPANCTIQYVGGEILTLPMDHLQECVFIGREVMGQYFGDVIDGVQSNLIGSKQRVDKLFSLFGRRIGTSVDNHSDLRRVNGSAMGYRVIFMQRVDELRQRKAFTPPAIFVVDEEGIRHIVEEARTAAALGYDLTLRLVFQGGKPIRQLSSAEAEEAICTVFDEWCMQQHIAIHPFASLVRRRLDDHGIDTGVSQSPDGCPFQNDCAGVALDLEPNGDLYVCLDMADSGQHRLGNAIARTFDWDVWQSLRDRTDNLSPACRSCEYLRACQGGCMSEAIAHTGDIYGRTAYCALWKRIFHRIDLAIEKHGAQAVHRWLRGILNA